MADSLADSMEQGNDAAFEECGTSPPDDVVQECPFQTRGQRLLHAAKEKAGELKQKVTEYKAAVKEKLKNLFTEDERAGLESMKNNVGIFPIFNAHGFAVDAIFHRVNKEFGWGKTDQPEDQPEAQPEESR